MSDHSMYRGSNIGVAEHILVMLYVHAIVLDLGHNSGYMLPICWHLVLCNACHCYHLVGDAVAM